MATYNSDHPALPPLASGAPDSPAGAIASGAPLDPTDMAAATRQVKRRRVLEAASPRRATEEEVQEAVKREFCVHAENATGTVAMPPWVQTLQDQITNLQNQITNLQNQNTNLEHRQLNAATFAPNHPIHPIRNNAGALPPAGFPANRLALDSMTEGQLGNLLAFYGLPSDPVATRLERVKMHLGIRA